MTLKRVRYQALVHGRSGTNCPPGVDCLDAHRGYAGAIIFTDGHAPVPRMPLYRHTRIPWLFDKEATYRAIHSALRPTGRATFLKEA